MVLLVSSCKVEHSYWTSQAALSMPVNSTRVLHASQWCLFAQVLAALGLSVKRSLAELSRAINGDAKTEVLPLFYVSLELEKAVGTSDTVELRPTLQDLANMIRSVCREILQVCMPPHCKPATKSLRFVVA
jgi:hypothetical protein